MHEVALAVGPVAVILVGILFAIFYNQRAIDKVEPRIDRMETRIDANFSLVRHTLEIIQSDLKNFHRITGQPDEALVTIEKRLDL